MIRFSLGGYRPFSAGCETIASVRLLPSVAVACNDSMTYTYARTKIHLSVHNSRGQGVLTHYIGTYPAGLSIFARYQSFVVFRFWDPPQCVSYDTRC